MELCNAYLSSNVHFEAYLEVMGFYIYRVRYDTEDCNDKVTIWYQLGDIVGKKYDIQMTVTMLRPELDGKEQQVLLCKVVSFYSNHIEDIPLIGLCITEEQTMYDALHFILEYKAAY